MGQNTALKTRRLKKGPTTEKRRRKDKAQGTKGRFQQKAARNTKRGGNIYVKYI